MKNVSVMIKPSSSDCNLQCKYCFYNSVASSRQDFSHGRITSETSDNIISKAFEYSSGGSVFFVFQGGEPLLSGVNFFKAFFESAYNKKDKCNVSFSVQTNGTLLDDDFAELFKKYKVLVGLSLDGNKNDNIYRVKKDGSEAFKDITRAAAVLKNHKVDFNILSVVTKKTAVNIIDIYNYFKIKGYRHLQFIPCLKPLGTDDYDNDMYMDTSEYGEFLSNLFGLYYNDAVNGNYVSVRSMDNYVLLAKGFPGEQCSMNGMCSEQYVIEGNGDCYPCDFYCTDEYLLGNINTDGFAEMRESDNMKKFMSGASVISSQCRKCRYVSLCRGTGCRRYAEDGNMCEAYKKFFSDNAQKIMFLARKFS